MNTSINGSILVERERLEELNFNRSDIKTYMDYITKTRCIVHDTDADEIEKILELDDKEYSIYVENKIYEIKNEDKMGYDCR